MANMKKNIPRLHGKFLQENRRSEIGRSPAKKKAENKECRNGVEIFSHKLSIRSEKNVRKEGFGALRFAVLVASGISAVLAPGRPAASSIER